VISNAEAAMAFGWYILGIVGVVLVFALLRIVSKMAKEREAAKRRKEAAMHPLAEDTITYAGHS
jgi:uncharacterized membrane protein